MATASPMPALVPAPTEFKWVPAAVAASVAVVAISGFLTYREYAKTTPLGAQSFLTEMETDRAHSRDKVRLQELHIREGELELQQQQFEKRCK